MGSPWNLATARQREDNGRHRELLLIGEFGGGVPQKPMSGREAGLGFNTMDSVTAIGGNVEARFTSLLVGVDMSSTRNPWSVEQRALVASC